MEFCVPPTYPDAHVKHIWARQCCIYHKPFFRLKKTKYTCLDNSVLISTMALKKDRLCLYLRFYIFFLKLYVSTTTSNHNRYCIIRIVCTCFYKVYETLWCSINDNKTQWQTAVNFFQQLSVSLGIPCTFLSPKKYIIFIILWSCWIYVLLEKHWTEVNSYIKEF